MAPTAADTGPGVFIPPPLFYAAGLGLGWWLETRWPWRLGTGLWAEVAGAALVLLSAAGLLWATRWFVRAGTPLVPVKPATVLVTRGPYRFSRNPMYVSLTLGYAGVALLINSGWPLLLLPAVWAALQCWVIPREERHLRRVFGAEYEAWARHVRRWL